MNETPTAPERIPIPCALAEEALSARLDGEPSPVDQDVLDAHLSQCASCRFYAESGPALHRQLRLRPAERVPDRAAQIYRAILSTRTATRRRAAMPIRVILALIGAVQIVLTAPALLLGDDGSLPFHAAHEIGSFGLALGAGLLIAAWQPRRAAGLLPVFAVATAALVATASADVITRQTVLAREWGHALALVGSVLVWMLAEPGRSRRLATVSTRETAA